MALILLAATDKIYGRVIGKNLFTKYHKTIVYSKVSSILEHLSNKGVDILILDADETDYDALELCNILSGNSEYSSIATLILHNKANNDFRVKAIGLGVEDLIDKPVDFDELGIRIQFIIRQKKILELLKSTHAASYNIYNYQKIINDNLIKASIIIVSKFELVFGYYCKILENEGLNIIWAKNYEELNQNLVTIQPSLVIFCPELQKEAFEIFALLPNTSIQDCFFIMLADILNIENFRTSFDIGFNNYITLSINDEELKLRVQKILCDRKYFCFLKASMQGSIDSSMRDKLTGLFNQRYLDNYALFFNENSNQDSNDEVFLIFIDIDDFKKVNDNYGHDSGDLVLQYVANIIKSSIRKNDIAIRYGGDEFVIIANCTSFETVKNISLRITSSFEKAKIKINDENSITVTASVGFSKKEANFSIQEILKNADKMLYKAKNTGKNRVVY